AQRATTLARPSNLRMLTSRDTAFETEYVLQDQLLSALRAAFLRLYHVGFFTIKFFTQRFCACAHPDSWICRRETVNRRDKTAPLNVSDRFGNCFQIDCLSLGAGIERLDELVRIERPQVGDFLADPDKPHRNLQFVADPENHAALGGAVELGEDDAGDV